jgi:hypothetical protein
MISTGSSTLNHPDSYLQPGHSPAAACSTISSSQTNRRIVLHFGGVKALAVAPSMTEKGKALLTSVRDGL